MDHRTMTLFSHIHEQILELIELAPHEGMLMLDTLIYQLKHERKAKAQAA